MSYQLINKKILVLTLCIAIVFVSASCAFLIKPIDKKVGLSDSANQLKDKIENQKWTEAQTALEEYKEKWKKIKPLLQIEIDLDYVNDIDNYITELEAFIELKDKSQAYPKALLLKQTLENINSL